MASVSNKQKSMSTHRTVSNRRCKGRGQQKQHFQEVRQTKAKTKAMTENGADVQIQTKENLICRKRYKDEDYRQKKKKVT